MSASNTVNSMEYVRLGKSGLKVSKVILYVMNVVPTALLRNRWRSHLHRGCMSYGSSKWLDWVLDEAEGKGVGHSGGIPSG